MRCRITAGLVLAAEAGHLMAAYEEAAAWPLLSGCHVLLAAGYGLLSAALLRRPPGRRAVRTATGMALTLPLLWLGTRTVGLPTYLTFTQLEVTPAGIGTTLVEVALVAALLTGPAARDRGVCHRQGAVPPAAVDFGWAVRRRGVGGSWRGEGGRPWRSTPS